MGLRRGTAELLARLERRARVRLHQAANRMEDADPLDVTVAEVSVRALDVVDRVTGFRAEHARHVEVPQGGDAPLPPIAGTPYAGPLDVAALPVPTRVRLRQRYRRWEETMRRMRAGPRHARDVSGGHRGWTAEQLEELTGHYEAWRAELTVAMAATPPAADGPPAP